MVLLIQCESSEHKISTIRLLRNFLKSTTSCHLGDFCENTYIEQNVYLVETFPSLETAMIE